MGQLVEPGRPAPTFTAPDQHGGTVALADLRGAPVVLYFYPKDDTPGCTKESCQFRDLRPKFERSAAVILGVSPDGEESHARFADKYDLDFTLVADPPAEGKTPKICDDYGVWKEKSMYGKKYMGVVRTTYLIDADGNVSRRWDDVKVPGHGDEVLAAVEALGG